MADPHCAHHSDRDAIGPCSVCGTMLCAACSRQLEGEILCEHCALPRTTDGGTSLDGGGDDASDIPILGDQPGSEESRPVAAPPSQRGPTLRLPAALFALLAAQALATLLLGVHLWRLTDRFDPRSAATPSAGLMPAFAPRLDPPRSPPRAGLPIEITGSATKGELIALSINEHIVAVDLLRTERFRFPAIELGPGDYRLTAIAYERGGITATSSELRFRVDPATDAGTTLTPDPNATPESRVVTLTTPTPTPTRSPRPTPVSRPSPETPEPTAGARANNVSHGRARQHMALTFDGGSNATQAETVLAALRAKGVKSTLFLTGEFISAYPELTRRIVREGHEVGNHTLNHPHLCDWVAGRGHITKTGVTRAFLLHQLSETRRLFESTTGTKLEPYWRAPYGEFNKEILSWAAADGWTHIGWTDGFDTLDWVADPKDSLYRSGIQIRDRLLARARSGGNARGSIVLMHLGAERARDAAADQLPSIIDGLRHEGYELVTVTSLMGG